MRIKTNKVGTILLMTVALLSIPACGGSMLTDKGEDVRDCIIDTPILFLGCIIN